MKVKHEYTVNEFAKLCNTTIRTINHYVDLGLIRPYKVLDNGYRIFNIYQIDQISSIMLYQDYGFSLKQIKELLSENDLDSHVQQLKLQKEIIEKQKKTLLDKESRITYTLEEINKSKTTPELHFSTIHNQTISITPVLHKSDRFMINYLSDGFRCGVMIDPSEKRITGYFSTDEQGTTTLNGKCLCIYLATPGFDVQTALKLFTEAADTYHFPLSNIFIETILDTNGLYLFKYFMMIEPQS